MTKHDDDFYLEGIREHIAAIRAYIPKTKEAFLEDAKTQDAVLLRLVALGEEISHLSEHYREVHADQEWFAIIGLRNRIAHGYFEVDKDTVWALLTEGPLDELAEFVGNT